MFDISDFSTISSTMRWCSKDTFGALLQDNHLWRLQKLGCSSHNNPNCELLTMNTNKKYTCFGSITRFSAVKTQFSNANCASWQLDILSVSMNSLPIKHKNTRTDLPELSWAASWAAVASNHLRAETFLRENRPGALLRRKLLQLVFHSPVTWFCILPDDTT